MVVTQLFYDVDLFLKVGVWYGLGGKGEGAWQPGGGGWGSELCGGG